MKDISWHEVTVHKTTIIEVPAYRSQIDMGSYFVNVERKYTEEQKRHIKEYFGWDVKDL